MLSHPDAPFSNCYTKMRTEFFLRINIRVQPFIREVRVLSVTYVQTCGDLARYLAMLCTRTYSKVIRVVAFSSGVHKIRKIFT